MWCFFNLKTHMFIPDYPYMAGELMRYVQGFPKAHESHFAEYDCLILRPPDEAVLINLKRHYEEGFA